MCEILDNFLCKNHVDFELEKKIGEMSYFATNLVQF